MKNKVSCRFSGRRSAVAVALWSLILCPLWASADWPSEHHDAQRTRRTAVPGTMTGAAGGVAGIAWQQFMGAPIPSPNVRIHDTDGDGEVEFVVPALGRTHVHELDGSRLWTSPSVGTSALPTRRSRLSLTLEGAPTLTTA